MVLLPVVLLPVVLGTAAGVTAQEATAPPPTQMPFPSVQRIVGPPAVEVPGEPAFRPPWRSGERLEYELRMSPLGRVAGASFSILPGGMIRGVPTVLFHSEVRGRVLLARVEKDNRSWVDPSRMVSLRYESEAREFTFRKHERVQIYADSGRWEDDLSESRGALPSSHPIDQLALLYYTRGLPLEVGDTVRITRYFRAEENPVTLRVLRREVVTVPAGEFSALVVEIHFAPRRRFEEGGVTTLYLSDDPRRVLLRMETPVPLFGTVDMRLTRITRTPT